jgi:molecular chaperone HtpG
MIKKQVTKKTLDLLDELARDRRTEYEELWATFGAILKEGLALDGEYRERLADLARFRSSAKDEAWTSLVDYVARMPAEQAAIYYIVGESAKVAESSPHTEALRQRGYEVLYMTDPVDEWALEAVRDYKGKPLVSAMRADLPLNASEEAKKEREAQAGVLKPLLEKMKSVLGERVRDVKVSERLTESPCCLVVAGHDPSAYVERLLRERGHAIPKAKRILEVNAGHPIIQDLAVLVSKDAGAARAVDFIEVLYEQALLTEGSTLEDPNRFAKRVTELLAAAVKQ